MGLLRRNHLYRRTYFARISCTGFCTDFLHGFLHGFCARIFARIFAWICARIFARFFCADALHELLHTLFARISRGVPKHLLRSAKNPQRKSPRKFSMLWGPSGEGLGRQEGEVETLANLTKASLGLGWLGGSPVEEVAILVDLIQSSKRQDPNHAKPRIAERGRPERTMNRDPELCSNFFKRNISPKISSAPWAP